MRRTGWLALSAWLAVAVAMSSVAAEQAFYSPAVGKDYPRQVYWGDTHLHTNLSPDAAAGGNRQFGPDTAYRLAKGETITAHNGMPVRLNRPLDFLLVSDHAEYMGLFPGLDAADPRLLESEVGRRWYDMLRAGEEEAAEILVEFGAALRDRLDLLDSPAFERSVWDSVIAAAESNNDPGKFSALIGYEWSSGRGGGNMHRIVLFRDGAERASQILPYSSFDGDRPRELWDFMRRYEAATGGQVLAIPHNPNTSAGLMFRRTDSDGNAMTPAYARARARYEPLLEVTQYKGDSETHPYVSPEDEFADYESWDWYAGFSNSRRHEDWMFAGEYARPALRSGLALKTELGVNPFKFGLIGSTDSHTGIPTADENNFWGKFTWHEANPSRAIERFVNIPDLVQMEWDMAASGYAAVWAHENTRASLFDALRRKEAYATTGPRMTVRLFGGWGFTEQDLNDPDWVEVGYENGVPMGGDLPQRPDGVAPSFMVRALKDPYGANLDRVQIVKGWTTADGETAERVYDLALSDGREVSTRTGKAPALVSTVDGAKYSNSLGAVELATLWVDPEFDPGQQAFYYVRVLEIVTPRWTAFDTAFFGTELPADVPMITQERAYTSPIWYSPAR